jgi:outer membrane protein assembly factor BamD (BamD/ComL family)
MAQPALANSRRRSTFWPLLLALLPCVGLSGCLSGPSWNPWSVVKKGADPATGSGDSLILTGGVLSKEASITGPHNPALDNAHDLFRQQKFSEAQHVFNSVHRNKNTSLLEAEEALYFEAECLRLQRYYPEAAQLYTKLVDDFPSGAKKAECLRRMFDIANYWLDETRDYMQKRNEQKEGKRSWVWPVAYIHMGDRTKPRLDMEGHAVKLLEKIYLNDIDDHHKVGEQALFWLGNIHFHHESYHEADHFYTQLYEMHKNGKHVEEAIELSIICKQLCTGGSQYDGRRLAEARDLIDRAFNAYPKLAHEKKDFLERQQITINMQQADTDYNIAKFYERTGHPGAAFFYYDIACRRYPGTQYAEKAAIRMAELRERAEVERQKQGGGPFGMFSTNPAPNQQGQPANNGQERPIFPLFGTTPEQLPPPRMQPNSGVNGSPMFDGGSAP